MDLLESSTQSFIVKVWIEETAEEAGQVVWRGHVTHVSSGERHYFKSLPEILSFMQPYLRDIGIGDTAVTYRNLWERWKLYLAGIASTNRES